MIKQELMDAHQARVSGFMHRAGQECPSKPMIPCEQVRRLRAALILEEALETVRALGFDANIFPNADSRHEIHLHSHDEGCNIVEVVDGCCDISVVTTGTLIAFGVGNKFVQALVDNNNLAKFGPGHSIREDGKLIKPPGHKPPDIAFELAVQGYVL